MPSGTFKRLPGGFLVAAPRLWPFASAQHFFATESQQVKIEARTQTVDLAYGLSAFVLLVATLIVADETGVGGTSGFLVLYTLAVVSLAAGSQIATSLAVRPLLAALPRSSESISLSERARLTAASSPWWRLVGADLFCAFLAVWLAPAGFNGLGHHFGIDLASTAVAWFWAIAFAGAAGYHFYLTMLKLRREPPYPRWN